jgi:L-lysine 6-transaminase
MVVSIRPEEPSDAVAIRRVIEAAFPTADEARLVDMLRATRFFEIIAAENLVENARRVGEHLLVKLQALAEEMPATVSNVRGRGLFVALDLPDTETRGRALSACLDNGLMALASGSTAIRMRPPLTLSTAEADEGVEKLRRALKGLAAR